MKKKILALLLIITSLFSFNALSYNAVAAGGLDDPCALSRTSCPSEVEGNGNEDTIKGYVKNVLNVLYIAIGTIAVVVIIVAGIMYMTATGDPGKIATAKKAIMYAVVGLVIAILAYAITNFILKTL